jgi:hypothetical protein
VRIPQRICFCLDWFGIQYDHKKVHDILSVYYLFIGVVDRALDTISIDIGARVLQQLRIPYVFPIDSLDTPAISITEYLKTRVAKEIFPEFLLKMELLYDAVCREQDCRCVLDYIRERELIGRLTAEISYILVASDFNREFPEVRKFMIQVGEVGCLIDSLIDLRSDRQNGLIQFRPDIRAHLELLIPTIVKGSQLLFQYPRLIPLFAAGIRDNIKDPSR